MGTESTARCAIVFQFPAAQKGHAFVPRRSRDLDLIFSLQFERTVERDNTVCFQNLHLQIEAVRWKATLAGCSVVVHQHLNGTISLTHGPHLPGRYTAQGANLTTTETPARRVVEKTLRGKVQKQTFPPRLEIPQLRGIPTFPQPRRLACTRTGHLMCYENRTF